MFKPSAWAIKNPLAPLLLLFIGVVLGLFSYKAIPITQFPDISVPVVQVSISQAGVSANEMERQVTTKVETAVNNIAGIKRVSSTVSESQSMTTIEFQLGTNTSDVLTDVKDKITQIRNQLPTGIDEPIVAKLDIEGGAVLTYALTDKNRNMESLTWLVDDTISRELSALKGAAKVERFGGQDPEIVFTVDPLKLQKHQVSLSQVAQALQASFKSSSAGFAVSGDKYFPLKVNGENTLEALPSTPIQVGSKVLTLQSLGTIEKRPEALRSISRLNGQPVITLSVYKAKGQSEVDLKARVLQKMTELSAKYKMDAVLVQDQVKQIENSYKATVSAFIEGTVLAVVVVFLFLRHIPATVISAVAIPFAAIPTFVVMQWLGFSLNMVSLLALSLVSGILVDDAIVEVENIIRHKKMGKTAYQAALDASDEIGLAVLATSAVIIAVFIPVSFMEGVVGQYFRQFGLTVAIAVFFSLLVARFITPIMSAYLLGDKEPSEHQPAWVGYYLKILNWALAHYKKTIAMGLAFIVLSGVAAVHVPAGFVSESDTGTGVFVFKFSAGTSLREADARLAQAASLIKSTVPEATAVLTQTGDPKSTIPSVSQGVLRTVYVHKSERHKSASVLEKEITALLKQVPGVEVSGLRPDGQKAVSISLVSKNTDLLYGYAKKVEQTLQSMPEFVGVESSLPKARTEWQFIPDYEVMAKYGVTSAMVAAELRQATQGETDSNAVKYKLPERELRITPTFGKTLTPDEVMALQVPTPQGLMPISAFGTIVSAETPSTITRLNQSKQVSLQSNLAPGEALGTAMDKLKSSQVWKDMPAEIKEVPMGDAELTAEMFASFQKAMGLGLFFVFATLLLLFNSVWRPFVILWSLPLSIGGALIGLYLAGQSMGISALIGILMLLGIVGKNAILLVDYAMEKEADGKSMETALVEAGEQRVQPIVMTTIAMVAGMVPVVLGLGDGSEFRIPMGVAVIGGLITATLLSLVFVPALYKASHLLIDKMKDTILRFSRK